MGDVFKVEFPSEELMLEGRLIISDAAGAAKGGSPAAVICHPHPQFGGSMDNNVVYALEEFLTRRGIITLAFNFRGMGRSGGQWDNMQGEVTDVIAALQFIASLPEVDAARVGLAGYSFGGLMALYARARMEKQIVETGADKNGVEHFRPKALALISPMLPVKGWQADEQLKHLFSSPPLTLIIAGTADQFCPLNSIKDLAMQIGPQAKLVIVEGADHFYGGDENDAGGHTAEFMARVLGK
jgi:alpha/beta superfamily hydrolase